MPRKRTSRIYTRSQGGQTRYYADFRDFDDVGGKREPLVVQGESFATTDPDVAVELAGLRLKQLEGFRRNRALMGYEKPRALEEYASYHLLRKARAQRVEASWIAESEGHLGEAVAHFGADRLLVSIGVRDIERYVDHLARLPSNRKNPDGTRRPISPGTQRHYLNALSNLFRRAQGEGVVPPGYNPVAALLEKPSGQAEEARWLEVHEAALLLESARTYPRIRGREAPTATLAGRLQAALTRRLGADEFGLRRLQQELRARGARADDDQLRHYLAGTRIPAAPLVALIAEVLQVEDEWLRNGGDERLGAIGAHSYALLATFLLTGAREQEVEGLDIDDVSLKRKVITIRDNAHRRIKTSTSRRHIPIWPQLAEVLQEYLESGIRPAGPGLLFRSETTREMIVDSRKMFDAVGRRAGWQPGEIRSKMFRHTYCAARLQTLDRGAPVSMYTVVREMGHGGDRLVRRVYGHLGEIRHRSDVVEYRPEQHLDVEGFADRLSGIGVAGTAE